MSRDDWITTSGACRCPTTPIDIQLSKRKAEDSNPRPLSPTRFQDGGRPIGELHLPFTFQYPARESNPVLRLEGPASHQSTSGAFNLIQQPASGRRWARSTDPVGPTRLATGARTLRVHLPFKDRGGNRTRVYGVAARRLTTRLPGQTRAEGCEIRMRPTGFEPAPPPWRGGALPGELRPRFKSRPALSNGPADHLLSMNHPWRRPCRSGLGPARRRRPDRARRWTWCP